MDRKTPPLCLRTDYEEMLDIGTRVAYHHRAGVARWMPLYGKPSDYRHGDIPLYGWKIVEGTLVHNGRSPETVKTGAWIDDFNHNTVREMFFNWPQAKFYKYWNPAYYPDIQPTTYNKTIMIWPDDGLGWIMGMVRKSIGASSKSYGRGEDFEQGYHDTDIYVDLYVVKPWYEGTQYVLCPLWAVRRVGWQRFLT